MIRPVVLLAGIAVLASCGPAPAATGVRPTQEAGTARLQPSDDAIAGGPPASVAPSGTAGAPPATRPPTPAPTVATVGAARSWPYSTDWQIEQVLFERNGNVYVVEGVLAEDEDTSADGSRIVALAADGVLRPGWPWSPSGDATGIIAGAALQVDGSLGVLVEHEHGLSDPSGWTFDRVSRDGVRSASLDLPDGDFCELVPATPEVGRAYVVCDESVTSVSLSDMSIAWSVVPPGEVGWAGVRPDGTLLMIAGDEPARIGVAPPVVSTPGVTWRKLAGASSGDGWLLDAGGTLWQRTIEQPYEECSGPRARTTYRALTGQGRTSAGWPVSLGWASDPPLATGDGRLFVTTASGRLHGFSSRGTELPGWPVRHLDVASGCWTPAPPVSAGGAGIVVVGMNHVTLVTLDGRVAPGWPAKVPYPLAASDPDYTPGSDMPMAPVVGRHGIYLAAYSSRKGSAKPRIIAFDLAGTLPSSWQRSFGDDSEIIRSLAIDPLGRIWAITDDGLYAVGQDELIGPPTNLPFVRW
jgi:hypothetical protein